MKSELLEIEDRLSWVTEALREYIVLCSTGENSCYLLRYLSDDLGQIGQELDRVRHTQ